MSTEPFSWLHLTDFHYGLKGQDCLWPNLREPFLESLAPLHERCGPWQVVFFTGDLVQSGESAQFAKLQAEVLDPLWRRLADLGSGDALLLAVPGNHDLYRPNPKSPEFDDPAMETLLQPSSFSKIADRFWTKPNCAYRRAVNDSFAAYNEWWEKTPHRPANVTKGALPGDFSTTIEHGKRHIGIVGLNTAFLQLGDGDYEGHLVWDAQQLHAVCDHGVDLWAKQHDLCLLLTHHGRNWLTEEARKHGDSEISPARRFAAHLFGHQHEARIEYIRHGGSKDAVRFCQGCSVFGLQKFGNPPQFKRTHGYAAGRIEFGAEETILRLWPRVATNNSGGWRFVPDHINAELEASDEGTAAETVAAQLPTKVEKSKSAVVAPRSSTTISWTSGSSIPHSTLPARRPFFGRKLDLEKIAKYLLPEDRSWGVVLDGPGGVGKTSLAIEAAHRAPAEHFPLKLWITAKNRELRPDGEHQLVDHRVDDYYGMLSELGLTLGREDISRALPDERPSLVRHALAQHRALLVLDNLETFSAIERRRLFELLGSLPPSCRAIVTSRRRTDGSSAAHAIRLDKLEREAVDELLVELGQQWPPVSRLTLAERNQLYAETGGNPLLLTWVAGQLGRITGRCRTVAEALNRLREAHRLQRLDAKNNPLDFIFGDLVETFTQDEIAVLASIVHFTEPAPVAWLLPLTRLSPKATETALDGLRDRGLLVEDDIIGAWSLPPLAAGYLRRVRPEAITASGQRLADWAYAYAAENGGRKFDRFPRLEAAWPQIAAALPLLIAGDNNRLQTFCNNILNFLETVGKWDELLHLCDEAEAKANINKDITNAFSRALWSGAFYFRRGQHTQLKASVDRIERYVEAPNLDAIYRLYAMRLRVEWLKLIGDSEAAIATCHEILNRARSAIPKSRDLSIFLGLSAQCLQERGEFDQADRDARESLAIANSLPDPQIAALATGLLSDLSLRREQWPEAERLAREALALNDGICDVEGIAFQSRRLAEALARQGRGVEGRPYAEQAVTIFTKLRSKELAFAESTLAACQDR
jgi:tetratricopeptide (TPR) repeat protein